LKTPPAFQLADLLEPQDDSPFDRAGAMKPESKKESSHTMDSEFEHI